ncbi:MAG: hypothetical protein R2713_03795 [Ilumatobacteraceae bacterium]
MSSTCSTRTVAHPTSAVVVGLLGGVDAEGDLPDDARQVESFAVICRDIADRKALEHRLALEAGHDLLTGLPNRQQLFRALSNRSPPANPSPCSSATSMASNS